MMANQVPLRDDLFIEDADGGTLNANKCKSCGQIFFPKTHLCLNCVQENMEEIYLSRAGKLYSYTIGHMPSIHFEPPYAVGLIDLPEWIRIFAPLKIIENIPFSVGMDMELEIGELWEEENMGIIGYRFVPVTAL